MIVNPSALRHALPGWDGGRLLASDPSWVADAWAELVAGEVCDEVGPQTVTRTEYNDGLRP